MPVGHLSFPLYLTHGVILCLVASRVGIWLLIGEDDGYVTAAIENSCCAAVPTSRLAVRSD
ncbi:hypothetical protein NK8_23120 [Caballeronia sp. NK8]|nr:hypothetical protein NK8_23120 [Caballeronia sp. NK8]